uniref:Glyco_transf_5 domain-containing protein n=1 Tax=Steinernema glaseri TaxID=37863 RepID=A0A1I8ASH1_9BILA
MAHRPARTLNHNSDVAVCQLANHACRRMHRADVRAPISKKAPSSKEALYPNRRWPPPLPPARLRAQLARACSYQKPSLHGRLMCSGLARCARSLQSTPVKSPGDIRARSVHGGSGDVYLARQWPQYLTRVRAHNLIILHNLSHPAMFSGGIKRAVKANIMTAECAPLILSGPPQACAQAAEEQVRS